MARAAKNPGCQVVEFRSYRAMPWRNGRGSTLEIAREPAAGEQFAWRLSLADIERDDDFSDYPGYGRALVLVAGKSLHLRFRGHGHRLLGPARRSTRFEGDWKTHCSVPEGRCTDLSLIVLRGSAARSGSVVRAPRMLHLTAMRRVVLSRGLYGALFVLDGSVLVRGSSRSRAHTVRARDTLLLHPGEERILTLRSLRPSPAQAVLLRWRPGGSSNSGAHLAPR